VPWLSGNIAVVGQGNTEHLSIVHWLYSNTKYRVWIVPVYELFCRRSFKFLIQDLNSNSHNVIDGAVYNLHRH
jgi:hypothetical protein